jgi:hypothetical protein
MEISLVRKRLRDSIEDARKNATARRAANQEAIAAWEQVLERVVTPLFQQVSQVLKSEGYAFRVITPAGTIRLSSERSADDYIEVGLDTSGPAPVVLARVNRTRGRERFNEEHIVASGDAIPGLSDERLLDLLTSMLGPFLER